MCSLLTNYRRKLEQEKGKKQALISSIEIKEKELQQAEKIQKNCVQAVPIVQLVAQQTQEELKFHISELVTLALAAVFDEPYEFNISFVLRRGKTEADILFLKNGMEVDPMTASGGGAVDVAAFALRVALWNLKVPKTNNTIILDEPARFISDDLQPKVGAMIKLLSAKLGIQFIIITHSNSLIEAADKVFVVKNKKGISYIEKEN